MLLRRGCRKQMGACCTHVESFRGKAEVELGAFGLRFESDGGSIVAPDFGSRTGKLAPICTFGDK